MAYANTTLRNALKLRAFAEISLTWDMRTVHVISKWSDRAPVHAGSAVPLRARLGWSEQALRREFQILEEEIEAAVRRKVPSGADVDVEGALGLLTRFLEYAERTSTRALRLASVGRGP